MSDPLITPAILGANCLIGLISGPVGNRADWAFVEGAREVGRILRLGTPKQNHHILRATQAAYVEAMRDMAESCAAIADDETGREAAAALSKLTHSRAFTGFRYDGEHFPLDTANQAIDRMFAGGIASLDGGGSDAEHRAFGQAVVDDLRNWGIALNETQQRLFTDGNGDAAPWHLRFRIAFGERLIADAKARTLFTQERLGEIRAHGILLIDELGSIQTKLDRGFAESAARDARLMAMLQEVLSTRGEEIAQNAISERAVIAIAKRVADDVDDPAQALKEIDAAIDELYALRTLAENLEPDAGDSAAAIDRDARRGDLEQAAEAIDSAYRKWKSAGDDHRAQSDTGRRLIDGAIHIHRLLRDADTTARWIALRLSLTEGDSVFASAGGEVQRLTVHGAATGSNLDLRVAGALATHALDIVTEARERAGLRLLRGRASLALARRTGERLDAEDAIEDFIAALDIYGDDASSDASASTLRDLAEALIQRSEYAPDRRYLERALRIIDELIAKEPEASFDWANLQRKRGHTLRRAAMLEQDSARLTEAISAFRLALPIITAAGSAVAITSAAGDLAMATLALGDETGDVAMLREAVTLSRQGLYIDRDVNVADRALSAMDLGIALQTLGEHTDGDAELNEAVFHLRTAMDLVDRHRDPLTWAMIVNNLANAMRTLGAVRRRAELIEDARKLLAELPLIYDREGKSADWAMVQTNIGCCENELGLMRADPAMFIAAVRSFERVASVTHADEAPLHWARNETNLAEALLNLAEHGGGRRAVTDAQSHAQNAIAILEPRGAAADLQTAEKMFARAKAMMARRDS